MATWKRRIGITLGGLIGLIVLAIAGFYAVATFKLNREHQIGAAVTPPIPTDSAAIARGHVFADLHGCTGCHAGNLAGQVMVDQFPLGRLAAPNLTRGKGGIGSLYTDAEWERAIRHGVRRNGRALLMMPSESFSKLRDDDVAALIAYVKSVPPVDNELPSRRIYPVAAALVALGPFTPAAERIDHAARSTGPEPGVTVAYGGYLAEACTGCHGEKLSGGQSGEPGSPPAPNLTRGGQVGRWSEADFLRAIRTGVTPAGRKLDGKYMPWPQLARLSETELRAIWMYLQSLAPVTPAAKTARS